MKLKRLSKSLKFILLPLFGIIFLLALIKYADNHLKAVDKNVLLVGISPDYPPFSTLEEEKMVGFDIDLIKAIAAKMEKKVKFKELTFPELLPALLNNKIDIIASGFSVNPNRADSISFTKPYWHSYLVAITSKNVNHLHIQDLNKNKKIGVIVGSIMEYHARKLFPKSQIITASSNGILINKLNLGELDAIVVENTQLPSLVSNNNRFNVLPVNDITIQLYALGLSKKNSLVKPININIELFKKNGTIQALAAKWNLINDY